MATIGFQLAYGNPEVRMIGEGAGAANSFYVGDLVYLAAGLVTVVADDATIYGVAGANASGTTGTLVPVYVIDPSQTWIAEADATTTAAYAGEDYGLNVTAGSMSVDIAETTNPAVVIKDLDPRDGATTGSGGRVLINFLPKVLQHMKGAGTSAL
jgi:hypothetical protein